MIWKYQEFLRINTDYYALLGVATTSCELLWIAMNYLVTRHWWELLESNTNLYKLIKQNCFHYKKLIELV